MRYNRADLDSTVRAAKQAAMKDDKPRYIFATAYGFVIKASPLKWQRNLVVYPSGRTEELAARSN